MHSQQHAVNVLRYWALVEELTPPVIEKDYKKNETKSIQNEVRENLDIPWLEKERFETHENTAQHKWRYTVFLGVNTVKVLLDIIENIFSETKGGNSAQGDEYTCMLGFKVDVNGRPLANSLEIPDYVVAIGCITQCDPPSLAGIDSDRKDTIREKIKDIYRNFCDEFDQKKRVQPIDYALLKRLLNDLLEIIGWEKIAKPIHTTPQNTIVAYGNKIPFSEKGQEKLFYNSYFVRDLNKAIKKWPENPSSISKPLQQYLAPEPPRQREDLADNNVLRKYVSPQLMAPARWPCAGDYPLAINQQAAVNLALSERSGIFSVNGPPGTGKTTLLNDIISNIIVERAQAIACLADPADAFEAPIHAVIDRKPYTIWKPKPLLQGYEIVLASNNNNAVENISKEIPARKTVDAQWQLDYFAALAEPILGLPACWGLCAAVLGRQGQVSTFFSRFWKKVRDKKAPGFNDWLLECMENKAKAQLDWKQAQKAFQSTLKAYNAIHQPLIDVAKDLDQLHTVTQQLQEIELQQEALVQQQADQEAALKAQEGPRALLEERYHDCMAQLKYWKRHRPNCWRRLRANEQYRQWAAGYAKALHAQKAAQQALRKWAGQVQEAQNELREIAQTQQALAGQIARLKQEAIKLEKYVAQHHKARMGGHLPDSAFWQQPIEVLQLCTPWHSEELHKWRGALFVAAMNLHRAFIGKAAEQFYDNFSTMNVLIANKKTWPGKEKVFPALWTSLCTVVPVISTTLASIGNLRGLGKEDIGWLLIDEAGQVAPQAAVGAIQRAKRVIAVGDPLQVPPVVNISQSMSKVFREHYRLNSVWDVHNTSVQQLADEANIFGTYIGRVQRIWLGAPLRVHRRCQNPMFEVANTIAYEGLMVQATSSETSELAQLLGTHGWAEGSYWIDVTGRLSGTKHWIKEEGAVVLQLLAHMCSIYQQLPNVYIISPFKNIKAEVQKLLWFHKERWITQGISYEEVSKWIGQSVGTIHTFQGKQADGVILVLGASADSEGALRFATESPNMLNVALTRAKDFCFVVGNHSVWSGREYFSKLAAHLTSITPEAGIPPTK